jgi:hypothetical protein
MSRQPATLQNKHQVRENGYVTRFAEEADLASRLCGLKICNSKVQVEARLILRQPSELPLNTAMPIDPAKAECVRPAGPGSILCEFASGAVVRAEPPRRGQGETIGS